jgi:hypothetical protein
MSNYNPKGQIIKIILEPHQKDSPLDFLYGKYAGVDLLGPLETEHQQEIKHDHKFRS